MQVVRSEQLSILCTIKRSKARCLLMPNMAEEKQCYITLSSFSLVALIAGVLGFWAVAGIAATVAKIPSVRLSNYLYRESGKPISRAGPEGARRQNGALSFVPLIG